MFSSKPGELTPEEWAELKERLLHRFRYKPEDQNNDMTRVILELEARVNGAKK